MTFNLTNISRPHDFFITANTVSDNLFGPVIVILTFVISMLYLATGERPAGYAFATAAFMTAIISVMLLVIGIVQAWLIYITIIATIGGVAYVVFKQG